MACRPHRNLRAAWGSGRLWSARCGEEQPHFAQARRGAVRCVWMRAWLHHDGVGCRALSGQRGKNPVECAHPAPGHKTVVEGFVQAIGGVGIAPHQPVAGDMDQGADHTPVINPRHMAAMRSSGPSQAVMPAAAAPSRSERCRGPQIAPFVHNRAQASFDLRTRCQRPASPIIVTPFSSDADDAKGRARHAAQSRRATPTRQPCQPRAGLIPGARAPRNVRIGQVGAGGLS
jgi:hypothetical protein